jgi:hypothetical protein
LPNARPEYFDTKKEDIKLIDKTITEKTLMINVPENQTTTVAVHLEIETKCSCALDLRPREGSYTDTEPRRLKAPATRKARFRW